MANVTLKLLSFGLVCCSLKVLTISAITVKSFGGIDNSPCCESSGTACKSLSYALSCISNSSTASPTDVMVDGDASLNGRTELTIPYDYRITISSLSSTPATISCESGNSMMVIRSIGGASVSFRNIVVRNCGPNVPSAILIEGPLKATFDNCTFMDNFCSGLNSRDASLMVNNSRFINNIANQSNSFDINFAFGNTSFGGGLGVMFDKGIGNKVEILSSDFTLGSAFFNKDSDAVSHDTDKAKLLANYYASGGGIAVINTFDCKDNTVIIRNCNFMHNKGTYGSGMFFTFVHNATGNSILVQNCTIAHNFASHTGGGVLVTSWDKGHNNTVILRNCNIFANNAMAGGAIKVIYNSIDPFNENKGGIIDFQMHDCNVFGNKAKSGSALRLLSNLPFGLTPSLVPKLYNCIISGHSPATGSKEYSGAVLSTKLGIEFHGNNFLLNNTHGSAIHISSAIIHVRGTLVFQGNIGLKGGAAYLAESSKIVLYPHSYLKFNKNHADFRGGAIYSEVVTLREVVYPFNPGCFLQYSEKRVPPSKWKTKVEFTNNTASMKGAALFLNSLVGCLWVEDEEDKQLNQTLRWSNKITYSGNFVLLEGNGVKLEGPKADIATDTYSIDFQNSQEPLQVAPGEKFTLNISAKDQFGNEVSSLLMVQQIYKSSFNVEIPIDQQYFVLFPGRKINPQLTIKSPTYETTAGINDAELIRISAPQSNFLVEKDVRMETQKCYPGFIPHGSTCACDSKIPGLDRCSEGRYLYLKEGYWGGMVNGRFVTHICPREYCECSRDVGTTGCFYDFKKPDDICFEGRSGRLCGRCKGGLSLSLNPTKCTDCDNNGYALAIVIAVVLLLSFLIIAFNSDISADLRGILFYIQMLPYSFIPNDEVVGIVNTIAGIADLGRSTEYPFKYCAMPGLNNLKSKALNFVTPVVVLVVFIVAYIFLRIMKIERKKPFQCFFTLIIMMCKNLLETSFTIMHCVDVGGKKVFFHDGSLECYKGDHLGLFIISVVVVVAVAVLAMIVLPIRVEIGERKEHNNSNIHQPVFNAITDGLRRYKRSKNSINWLDYLKKERGWWWSVDFLRRVLVVGLYVFMPGWERKQIAITVAYACILTLHLFAWPYNDENPLANEMEAFLLFALVALGIFQFIEDASTRYIVSIIILALTLTPAGFYMIFKVIKYIRKKNDKGGAAKNGQKEMGHVNGDLYVCGNECFHEITSM